MNRPRTIHQRPHICVADVDTRLSCRTYCAVCAFYVRDRRAGERRTIWRATHDRRILNRI